MSAPYKKEYDKNGVLINPITKENPYLHATKLKRMHWRGWQTVRNKYFTGKTAVVL